MSRDQHLGSRCARSCRAKAVKNSEREALWVEGDGYRLLVIERESNVATYTFVTVIELTTIIVYARFTIIRTINIHFSHLTINLS